MSVFDETKSQETTEQTQEEKDYLEELVGEGKKFKDAQALAKGKFESDRYIQNLERQLNELREDLTKEDKIDQLMELVRSQNNQSTNNPPNGVGNEDAGGGEDPNGTSSDLTEERLRELIESTVTERENTTKRQSNLNEVDRTLEEKFGDKAGHFVNEKAKELGMSLKEMEDLAARNPRAFFQLTGVNQSARSQSTLVGGGRPGETETSSSRGEVRNFAYYQKMRRENKSKYYTPEVQHQYIKDAEAMGDSFFE